MSDETKAAGPLTDVEERDLQWLQEVYQGDHQRQLTWRAVLTGGILGMFLSISNLYTTLKLGWAFGVAITACVMSYVLWNAFRALTGGRGHLGAIGSGPVAYELGENRCASSARVLQLF